MRIFVGSLMIFFGTLLVAALFALGHPGGWGMPALDAAAGQRMAQPGDTPNWHRVVALLGLR